MAESEEIVGSSIAKKVAEAFKWILIIFCFAADRAGFPHDRHKHLFVGENAMEKQFAKEAGFRVFKKPNDALTVIMI